MSAELVELMRWTRIPLPAGGVALADPDEPGTTVRIQNGLRPLRSLRSLVSTLARDATPLGPIRHLVTDTGDHAAMIALTVQPAGEPRARIVGTAIGDDEYTLIEGTAREHGLISGLVEQLLCSRVHADAPERARMVPYRLPAGWFGIRRPLATCWLAPRYPRDRSRLVVCDAIPAASAVAATQELLWPCEVPLDASTTELESTPIRGRLAHWTHDGTISALADLSDGAFRYRVQLHDGTAEALETLRDVLATIEPIKRPVMPVALASAHMFAWLN